jgi:hypothetical protein
MTTKTPTNQPRYPIYIPTKGRYKSRLTIKALEQINVPYLAVVEPQEHDLYAAAGVPESRMLVLPGNDGGLVVARNWIWDHARDAGHKRFWTFDDNIRYFLRLNRNRKVMCGDGTFLRVMEDFTERYVNVPISGMHCFTFVHRKHAHPPVRANRRVYSNMLIETDYRDPNGKPYRNEGFYNDDTDLNLRVLKDGNCTLLFCAFLIAKIATMTMRGGMTPHYDKSLNREDDGRWKATMELYEKHPDVVKIIRRWGRWHHYIDYKRFQVNRLRLRPDLDLSNAGTNEYGMQLVKAD